MKHELALSVGVLLAFALPGAFAAEPELETPELAPDQLEQYQFERDPEDLEMAVDELSMGQKFILQKQRLEITALMARRLGILQFHDDLGDLDLLQRIVDEKIIAADDAATWQALGVVLGDLLARELDLHWVQVEDEVGASKALQYKDTQSFVFPVTMFSRRIQFGEEIDVHAMYAKVEADVASFRELDKLEGLNPPDEHL